MYVTLREVLAEARRLGMAIGAFNTHNLEMVPAIVRGAIAKNVPVIIQTSCGTANFVGHRNLVAVCRQMADDHGVQVVLHLDHATDHDEIRKAIDAGYSSVMFDGSALPLKDNILGTLRVVEYANRAGVSVEAELGVIGGREEGVDVHLDQARYTDPEVAAEFVETTGIDALAVAIGTRHGSYQGKTEISFDRLEAIHQAVSLPLVVHGGTGVKDDDVSRLLALGIAKFNVGTELLVTWNRLSTELYSAHKVNTSNRNNVMPCLDAIQQIVENKLDLFINRAV
ncbi:MAG: class II fructose-bisphosphate aldolase [Propionicimonas sp.]